MVAKKDPTPPIHVVGDYYLSRDKFNWILNKSRVSEKHQVVVYDEIGYFGNAKSFSDGVGKRAGLELAGEAKSIDELINAIDNLSAQVLLKVKEAA